VTYFSWQPMVAAHRSTYIHTRCLLVIVRCVLAIVNTWIESVTFDNCFIGLRYSLLDTQQHFAGCWRRNKGAQVKSNHLLLCLCYTCATTDPSCICLQSRQFWLLITCSILRFELNAMRALGTNVKKGRAANRNQMVTNFYKEQS